jgi:hypothetical protein
MDKQPDAAPAAAPADHDPAIEIEGKRYMRDAGGRLVPEGLVKPEHLLEDDTVRTIVAHAKALHAQIGRFRGHTFDDVTSFVDLLAEKYGGRRGGAKGNITLTSYDGLRKVVVQVQDRLTFGPELQIAKELVDSCISGWAQGANDNIRALVEHAFQVDREGRINRASLFQLRRLSIEDEEWQAAMAALSDAIRVIGSKAYLRFYERDDPKGRWQPITIDLAAAS